MNKKHTYHDAKAIIDAIRDAAEAGNYPTRQSFMDMLERNPRVAVQGYNAYGRIFFWNSASSHLYGYRESEAINKDLVDLILPPEMARFAHDMILLGRKTGKMPEPSACDLLNSEGEYVTVYSGHLVFQWENATTPEFYCVDLALKAAPEEAPARAL